MITVTIEQDRPGGGKPHRLGYAEIRYGKDERILATFVDSTQVELGQIEVTSPPPGFWPGWAVVAGSACSPRPVRREAGAG